MFHRSSVCEGENNLLVECMAGCTAACIAHANTEGGEGKTRTIKNQVFFLKTLVRQVDVQRKIHIHVYLADNSVLV